MADLDDDDATSELEEAPNALTLHLAGFSDQEIAAQLQTPEPVVKAQISHELHVRHPDTPATLAAELERVSALWRPMYVKAIKGDTEAMQLAVRLSQYRSILAARAGTTKKPDPAHTGLAPTVAVRTAWQILAGNAPAVAQSLVDIATSSPNDGARVTAAIAVMDRVGIGRVERSEVAVHLLDHSAQQLDPDNADNAPSSAAQLVRDRLKAIAARHPSPGDDDVIDAVTE